MGISWLSPLYLIGLCLLSLPILIHLVRKQHSRAIEFPSLMFLREIPVPEKTRLKIRHWILLLLRCLLLLLIVLAFSRPFLPVNDEAGSTATLRSDSVILIDNSYSMRIAKRWQMATDTALKLIDEKSIMDRIAVISFDDKPLMLSDLTTNSDHLRAVINQQKPGLRTTRLAPALEQAARILASSQASEKQIHLISDFRASKETTAEIGSDIKVSTIAVGTAVPANPTIASWRVTPSVQPSSNNFALELTIHNQSDIALPSQIDLSLNGSLLDSKNFKLAPAGTTETGFDEFIIGKTPGRGSINLKADQSELDSRLFLVFSDQRQIPVLILEGAQPRDNQSIYLENALRLLPDPGYRVTRASWDQIKPEELASWSVIIINDSSIPEGQYTSSLQAFVNAGGGLLLATGENTDYRWPSGERGFLPGTLGGRMDTNQGNSFEIISNSSNQDLTIDLSSAQVFSYRKLNPDVDDRILSVFNNGDAALLERTTQPGRVLVLTTTLDTHWNNLALKPLFLPFLQRVLTYLAAYQPYKTEFEIGEIVDVIAYARSFTGSDVILSSPNAALVVETPSAAEIRLNPQSPLLPLNEPGFYQIHIGNPDRVEVILAANINPAEISLEKLDPERLLEEIRASAIAPTKTGIVSRRQADEYEQQQQLWYGILSLVLVLIILEAFSANWIYSRAASPVRS